MVTVYTRTHCQQCNATKRKLTKEGVDWVAINTEEDEAAADFLRDSGFREVPVVFTEEGESWTGYRPDLIAALADRLKAAQ